MTNPLVAAAEALERAEFTAALSALLDAWELAPTEELALLIAEVGKAALPAKDPILTSERDSQRQAWLELAEQKNSVSIPWLLGATSESLLPKHLTMLTTFRPDPRCGQFALEHLPKVMIAQGDKLQLAMISLLTHSRHPGARKLLEALDEGRPGFTRFAQAGLAQLAPASTHTHLAADLTRLTSAVAGIVTQARAANRTVDELYAAVYANPDSDDARHVLADALLQNGDARGELIALQLNPEKASSKKAATLLKRLAPEISRQVAPLMDVVIERGFPVAAVAADERATARPQFRTLRRLTVLQPGCTFVAAPELSNVREIAGTVECLLPALEQGTTLSWEQIDLGALTPANHRAFIEALSRVPRLQALKSPAVCIEAVAAWGATGRAVALDFGFPDSAALVEALRQGFEHRWALSFACRPASVRGVLKDGALSLQVKSSSAPHEQAALLSLLEGKRAAVTLGENVGADDHRWDHLNPQRSSA